MDTALMDFQVELRSVLARMEAKIDMLLSPHAKPTDTDDRSGDLVLLAQFTTKQHAIIQMLMRDANAEEIAERLKVKATTIRTHLTMIASKLGVQRRASIISKLAPIYERVSNAAYMEASSGLPKDWDRNYRPDDPINALVENKG